MIGRPASLRVYNKRAIVRALLRHAPASRADLAKQIGMSQVTAGKIVDELLADDIVEETESPAPKAAARLGRPGRMLRLNTSRCPFLAIQVGSSHTRLARVAIGLHSEDQWPVTFETPQIAGEWKRRLARAARELDSDEVVAALVSVPGVVDERSGRVLLAPNLHWLDTVNLMEIVTEATGKRVTLLQEIRALAYGQLAVEPIDPKRSADFLLVDFGDGLGAAAAINGKLYVGPLALNGELGHTPVVGNLRPCGCGAVGCIETLVNRAGLLQSFADDTGKSGANWGDLVQHIEQNGLPEWFRKSLDQVATAVAAAANVMGIGRVIITGSMTELPPVVIEHLSASVISGCLWKRFGQMICYGAPRHRLAGLIAAGIDRIVMPVESWER